MTDAQEHPTKTYLGKTVKDVLSGLHGICNSVLIQASGNVMVAIQTQSKDNMQAPSEFTDAVGIDIIDGGISDRVPAVEISDEFLMGSSVVDNISGFRGQITTLQWFINGCAQYSVISNTLSPKDGKPNVEYFGSTRLKLVEQAKPKAATKGKVKVTGGPNLPVHRAI